MIIPFADQWDNDYQSKQIKHRLKATRAFIGVDISEHKSLDIGTPNEFGQALGLLHNTLETDFNFALIAPSFDYDLIGAFEVFEHVMNPLNLAIECRELLADNGVLYISTPRPWFGFLQGKHHFTEYKPDRFIQMLTFAGFKVTRTRKIMFWDWSFIFWGIRPAIRTLTNRTILYECVKCH